MERSVIARSVYWSGISFWMRAAAQLTAFLFMTMLLGPELYGIGSIIGALVIPMEAMAGYLILESLIQREDLEPGHSDAMFWGLQGLGLTYLLLGFLLAPVIADFFRQPEFVYLVPLALIAPYLSSSTATPYALLRRALRFRAIAIAITVSDWCGAIVGVAMAAYGWGPASFVGMFVATTSTRCAIIWYAASWRPGFRARMRHFTDLLSFNATYMCIKLVEALNNAVPLLIVGRIFGPTATGHFSIALRFLDLLEETLMLPLQSVSFPVIARLQSDPGRLKGFYLTTARLAATIAAPSFVGVALIAPLIITLVLGPAWTESGYFLQVLAIIGLQKSYIWVNNSMMRGMAAPQFELRIGLTRLFLTAVTIYALSQYGPLGAAIAMAIGSVATWPMNMNYARRLVGYPFQDQIRPLLLPVSLALGMAVVLQSLQILPSFPASPLIALAVLIGAGAVSYVGLLFIFGRATFIDIVDLIRHAIPQRRKAT